MPEAIKAWEWTRKDPPKGCDLIRYVILFSCGKSALLIRYSGQCFVAPGGDFGDDDEDWRRVTLEEVLR